MPDVKLIRRAALRVTQPLGDFFAFTLDAETLTRLTYSQPAEVIDKEKSSPSDDFGYSIFGSQRQEKKNRLLEIAKFIRTEDATFPNAIILAANYGIDGNLIDEPEKRWRVVEEDNLLLIEIPDQVECSASIIDGQHRLHAFEYVPQENRKMELLCVAFLDLPIPYHAYVFATINFNQKKVDKSLAYELFGFDVDEKPAKLWPPETFAVYISRILNTDPESALFQKIVPAAYVNESNNLGANVAKEKGRISMATIVDGILKLISQKPKDDRYTLRLPENVSKGRKALQPILVLPLRTFYINENDKAIYTIVFNYLAAVKTVFWDKAAPGSYIVKTVGMQALFDVLKVVLSKVAIDAHNFSTNQLVKVLEPAGGVDFSAVEYQASGIGRTAIRKSILEKINQVHGGEAINNV